MSLAEKVLTQISKNHKVQQLLKEVKAASIQLKSRGKELNKKVNREGSKRMKDAMLRYNKLNLRITKAQEELEYEVHRARKIVEMIKKEVMATKRSSKKAAGAAKTTKKAAKRTTKKTTRKA